MNIVATGGMKDKMIKLLDLITEKSPCWKGYKQIGMKDKDGREVPNCVPIDEVQDETIECEKCGWRWKLSDLPGNAIFP